MTVAAPRRLAKVRERLPVRLAACGTRREHAVVVH
jgi:hypothetical protein